MNWEAIGAIGEVFGGVAVLATLIYLAVQVRQAKRQLKLNSVQIRAGHARDLMMPIAIDPSLASIMIKAGHPPFGGLGQEPHLDVLPHNTQVTTALKKGKAGANYGY